MKLTVTIPEFCEMVGIRRTKAFQLARDGEVIRAKLGRKTVITVASIEQLIERSVEGSQR